MNRHEKRLLELTKEIDGKIAEWVDLEEEIEALMEARKTFAKRHKLSLPKEEDDDRDTGIADNRPTRFPGCAETVPQN